MLNGLPWKQTDHSVIFETASTYCVLDSFVDHNGYSIFSKEFLRTAVDKMVIWENVICHLTKRGPLEKGMVNHCSILALRTPWTVWKGKKIGHWETNSAGLQVPNMLLEISGEITPERMNNGAKAKTTLSCGCDWVMEARSDAVKSNNIA